MTPRQVELVEESFAKIVGNKEAVATLFYMKLFDLDPSLRDLFKGDIKEQGRKLMAALTLAVQNLKRPELLSDALVQMGKRHRGYGVKDENYATVAAALLWTLEVGLDQDFTDEVRQAWVDTYTLVANTMMGVSSRAAA